MNVYRLRDLSVEWTSQLVYFSTSMKYGLCSGAAHQEPFISSDICSEHDESQHAGVADTSIPHALSVNAYDEAEERLAANDNMVFKHICKLSTTGLTRFTGAVQNCTS